VGEAGVIVSQAVLIAIGIDWDGRQVVAVELADRGNRSSRRDFLLGLRPGAASPNGLDRGCDRLPGPSGLTSRAPRQSRLARSFYFK
jgi:hypothetical protein